MTNVRQLTIRDMRLREAEQVAGLVMRSFSEFIAPDYNDEGRASFTAFTRPQKLAERHVYEHFTLVAEHGGEIVGMVQVWRPSHLLMLFVDKSFHRCGVARRLLASAIGRIRREEPHVNLLTVNSSPFALEIYTRLGFTVAGPEDRSDGVVCVPMAMRIP